MALKEQEKIAHLLRRFGMGSSERELEFYAPRGLDGTIQTLLDPGEDIPVDDFQPRDIDPRIAVNMQFVRYWWIAKMVTTRRPLEEKLTLFWHNHFATAAMKVDVAGVMHAQNELFRKLGLGSFQQLLVEVSKDPAMLYWLDNQFNVKGKPNENFAREIMELFTLGVGNYSEKDIQEAARAFTGWTYSTRRLARGNMAGDKPAPNSKFLFVEDRHDDGMKTVLGKKGPFNGNDICRILVENPQCARFIAKKMWVWFAYDKPEDELIDRLATTFRKSGMEIRTLVHAIMTAPEFYSEKCVRRMYKNPIDFCVVPLRQIGLGTTLLQSIKDSSGAGDVPASRARLAAVVGASRAASSMGMELLNPPDVSGWKGGADWISSATIVERIKFGERMFPKAAAPMLMDMLPAGAGGRVLADTLISLFDAQLPPSKVAQLRQVGEDVAKGPVTLRNVDAVARSIAKLLFGSPEFQFC